MNFIAVIVESRDLPDLRQIIDDHMKFLPGWYLDVVKDVPIKNGHDYNQLLTTSAFWEKYQAYHRVLLFQHDSKILRLGIDEFFPWDYVGSPWKSDAPWAREDRKGGNGGFSLRNPRTMMNLCREINYNPLSGNEDVWYVHNLEKIGGSVAPYEVCKKFGCETEFQLGTFGVHAIEKHLSAEQINKILTQYEYVESGEAF